MSRSGITEYNKKHKGQKYKPTQSGYRLVNDKEGNGFYLWVGKKKINRIKK